MNDYSELLPPMLFGEELKSRMLYLPEYDESCRTLEAGKRLLKLTDIYKVFVPQAMAVEVYHKLYMMAALSLKQKGTVNAVRQLNANHRWGLTGQFQGIITGASSSSIIGVSGIGKSTCVNKSIALFGTEIVIKKPYRRIIPAIIVTTPFDCNYKGLLYQILIAIDEVLGTEHYERAQKSNFNAQNILALVCQLCLLHVGILVIDEIQFLVQHKSGTMLYRMILQLINSSGISVMLVGTNECLDYFMQAPQMARRTAGLQYSNLDYGNDFRELTEKLFRYQYIREKAILTEGLISWLFEHTAGNPATLMALIHDSQEIAVMKGTEKLDVSVLTEAYTKRMKMLREYIEESRIRVSKTSKKKKEPKVEVPENVPEPETSAAAEIPDIFELAVSAKDKYTDALSVFRKHGIIEEVTV